MEVTLSQRGCMIYALTLTICKTFATDCEKHVCPDYKPYCTDIGCVFSCPQSEYINGSTCVTFCGDMFVDKGKTCQKECPPEKKFVSEITLRIGEKHHIEKHCINTCKKYVYNGTCVPTCPADTKYVDNNTCVGICPEDKQFIKKDHKLEIMKCSHNCSYQDVLEDGICVDYCFKHEFVYNGTCVSECPLEANNLITNKTHFNSTVCVTSCPDQMFLFGNMCVELCPEGMFVSSLTCVSKCPATQPSYEEINIYPNIFYGWSIWHSVRYLNCTSTCSSASRCYCPEKTPYLLLNSCFESCPHLGMLIRHNSGNMECVEDCYENEVKFNLTCVKTCPSDSCHVFNQTCLNACPAGLFGKPFLTEVGSDQLYKCIQKCPDNLFIDDKHCVSKCPNMNIGNTCVDMCPTNAPFEHNRECTVKCPHYLFNNTCVERCPSELRNVIDTVNGTCLSECPREYKLKRKNKDASVCLHECRLHEFLYNSTCVSTCPNMQIGNKCVDKCPSNAPFIKFKECTAYCPLHIFNNTCTLGCPKEQGYVIDTKNGTCISGCPPEYKLERKYDAVFYHFKTSQVERLQNIVCLQECRPDEFLYNSTCDSKCPQLANYAVNRSCMSGCPQEYRLKRKNNHNFVCLHVCSPDEFLHNSTCVLKCPQGANYAVNKSCTSTPCSPSYMFEHLGTIICVQNCPNVFPFYSSNYCVKQCPANKPFISKNMTCLDKCPFISRHVHNKYCSSTCSEDELLKNGSCISNKECKMPNVVYKTECLQYCPALYKVNFNNNQCETSVAYIITSVCIGILLFGFVVWKRVSIANFLEVTKYAGLLLVKGDKFDMSLYDTYRPNRSIPKRNKRNRGSAGSINSEDGIPLLDVSRTNSDDDEHEDSGQGEVNIDISDLISTHGSNELGEIESKF